MRGRGLKPLPGHGWSQARRVALHAGAWIETFSMNSPSVTTTVALHAGAWIETSTVMLRSALNSVALHAGAWIETYIKSVEPS